MEQNIPRTQKAITLVCTLHGFQHYDSPNAIESITEIHFHHCLDLWEVAKIHPTSMQLPLLLPIGEELKLHERWIVELVERHILGSQSR